MLLPFIGRSPQIPASCFVAENATVVGDVAMGEQCSVWYQVVIRGDVHRIRIGDRTNVQDGAILHVTHGTAPLTVGSDVTVGHGAILHGCTVHDRVLVGMGAVVMDHAVIGEDSLVGARALVTERTLVPPRSLVVGSPARVVRELTDAEVERVCRNAEGYVRYSRIYLGHETPETNPFYDAD